MSHHRFSLWELFLLFSLLEPSCASENDTVVVTSSGPIKGKLLSVGSASVTAYLGIPYAEPPLGKLRFQKPQPHQPWSGVLEATSFGNSCQQIKSENSGIPHADLLEVNTPLSEDCLFLNIWVPHPRPSTPAPVLIWIHGGGFIVGTASLDVYNGADLAATENIIVASMNYRLGFWGFLFLPPAAPGNVGLWDQWLALKWMKENAAAFGGDPAQLTLLGQSAGAAAVGFHLLSPASQPLFARAVLQSGAPNAPWAWKEPDTARENAVNVGRLLGCAQQNHTAVVICLQETDIQERVIPYITRSSSLTIDGEFLKDKPQKLLESGIFQMKPILTGVTSDEGALYALIVSLSAQGNNWTQTWEQSLSLINETLWRPIEGSAVKAIALKYSKDRHGAAWNQSTLAHYFRDYWFVCPLSEFAAQMAKSGNPVYIYIFNHRAFHSAWPKWAGAPHGAEVPYLFGTLALLGTNQSYPESEDALSRKVMHYWAEFARSGKPTGSTPDEVQWPLYNAADQNFFYINTEVPSLKRLSPPQHCDFLAEQFHTRHTNKS
ncbi:cholinesterase-like [Eublepharis macularius]|uniref:Carboxylic ester hydrolase n=1 Tax=Eublepharis macularius TaxID=481883 RepID=A0AA97J521_EUBMA|nr:cholinesterase-like [Eublepharis macularius]